MTDIKAILDVTIINPLIMHRDEINIRRLWLATVIDETSGEVLTHELSTKGNSDKAIKSALAKVFKAKVISESNIDERKNNVAKLLTVDSSLNSTALTEWANKFGITLRFCGRQMGSTIERIVHNILMPDTNHGPRNISNPNSAAYTLEDFNSLVSLKIKMHNNSIGAGGRGHTDLSPN